MFQKFLLPISSLIMLIVGLTIYACVKEHGNPIESAKGLSLLSSYTFPLIGNSGKCYSVTVETMSDSSVIVKKRLIEFIPSLKNKIHNFLKIERITPTEGRFLEGGWYVPLEGNNPPIQYKSGPGCTGGGGDFSCFCEGSSNCDDYVDGDLFCRVNDDNAGGGGLCLSPCCSDCDIDWCVNSLPTADPNGLLLRAKSITVIFEDQVQNRTDFIGSYFGGTTRIDIYKSNQSYIVNRVTLTNSEPTQGSIHNLTTVTPQNGSIHFLPTENFWFVPFDISLSAGNADPGGDDFECVVDGVCEGKCEVIPQSNGCLRCECSLNGDCDFKKASLLGGGIILEATNVTVTNW